MGIGPDIKEVFQEVGTSYNILRDDATISGEYLDFETKSESVQAFIRSYFLTASLAYDSVVLEGDIIEFGDLPYMVTTIVNTRFEDEIVERETVLYRCNVSGEIRRMSGETWGNDYKKVPNWQKIKENAYALLTQIERVNYTTEEEREPVGNIQYDSQILFLPSRYDIQENDRYVVSSGETSSEYYKVDTVKRRVFSGVDQCMLTDDRRNYP
jgi:hypothetical protein